MSRVKKTQNQDLWLFEVTSYFLIILGIECIDKSCRMINKIKMEAQVHFQ